MITSNEEKRIHTVVEIFGSGRWLASDVAAFPDQNIVMNDVEIAEFMAIGTAKAYSPWPFGKQPFAVYALLGGIDNDYGFEAIASWRGVPRDASVRTVKMMEESLATSFGHSWVSLDELLGIDYGKPASRPFSEQESEVPLRELLGPRYFADLAACLKFGPPAHTRIVFWFDEVAG